MKIYSLLNFSPTQTDLNISRSPSFMCHWSDCGKAFTRKSDLTRHERIHTGEKPFHCQWIGCGKQFIQRSALTVHFRTHTREKPHACTFMNCHKSFGDSSSLARHRRIHTGDRPYKCECGKEYTRMAALTKHKCQNHVKRMGSINYMEHNTLPFLIRPSYSDEESIQSNASPTLSPTAPPLLLSSFIHPMFSGLVNQKDNQNLPSLSFYLDIVNSDATFPLI